MASETISGDTSPSEKMTKKEVLVPQVKGKVKWFNVELGYGFINRDDTKNDVFVHHTAIIEYNKKHQLSSLADGEVVQFDVVQGKKGQEASNVTGPDGEEVKGSRFASNLYAGRFRFRRGSNYSGGGGGGGSGGGGGGGRRYYSRRPYQDRPAKEDGKDEDEKPDGEKVEKVDGELKKEPNRGRKYSRPRKPIGDMANLGGGNGRLKRSSSLPSDLNRYQSMEGGRRRPRRRGIRGLDSRPPFLRSNFNGPKRRGPRNSEKDNASEKRQGNKVEEAEANQESLKSDKEGQVEGKPKGQRAPRRKPVDEKSSKSDPATNEKSEKSQQPRRRKISQRAQKTSEAVSDKLESQSGPDDEQRQVKDDGGDGKQDKGNRRRGGRFRNRRRGSRSEGRSSSTDEQSTKTPSTRDVEEPKSEREKTSHGGNGDSSRKGEPNAAPPPAPVKEAVGGEA